MDILNTKIGILGGGQLGKMLCESASNWNLNISILEKSSSFPAVPVAKQFYKGSFNDADDVWNFGKKWMSSL